MFILKHLNPCNGKLLLVTTERSARVSESAPWPQQPSLSPLGLDLGAASLNLRRNTKTQSTPQDQINFTFLEKTRLMQCLAFSDAPHVEMG